MQDSVEPVDDVPPSERVEFETGHAPQQRPPRHGVVGEVIEVRAQSHRHAEAHGFDASVGEQSYPELVIRVLSGPYLDLKDKRVTITTTPQ